MRGMLKILLVLALCAVPTARAVAGEPALRHVPVPATVSPELGALIKTGPLPYWNRHPVTPAEWKAFDREFSEAVTPALSALREKLQVTVTPGQMAGVPVFTVMPAAKDPADAGRVLLHFHGGGYVLGQGEAGVQEAVLMAGMAGFKVISVDYRLAPDFPYPAALDDCLAVYRELLATTPAKNIGIFGTSTGGGLALAVILRAKAEGLPLPAAVAAGTPWTDLTKTGDSYAVNEGVDNVLVSYSGWLGEAALVYANGHDLTDPMLSPVYGDVSGFPPTLLVSGTRDLFLSNTVRMHLKLRQAGAIADLLVFEGMSHAQYLMDPNAPETAFLFGELGGFFRKFLR